jgi:hypothetical protein
MQRRTLLQLIASASATVPFHSIQLFAQPRELSPAAVAKLHMVAATALPASIGTERVRSTVEGFVAWTRGYREGVALAHGYGHPKLQKTGPSPVARYIAQLDALDDAARTKGGGTFAALALDARREILEAAFTKAGVRGLPARPSGQHVIADLMAFYFRSSEANDDCYRAMIQREVCRPIEITTKRPAPKG